MQLDQQLYKKIEEAVGLAGFVIFDVKFFYAGNTRSIRIFIDRAQGGITVKECVQVNQQLIPILDQDFGQEGFYNLEVSSPGMDWPLKETKDFTRVLGHQIRIFLKQPQAGKSELVGTLQEIKDNCLILEAEGQSQGVRLEDINRAKELY